MSAISCRRLIIAAIIFLAAAYMKYFLPAWAEAAMPALREVLDGDGPALPLPGEVAAWLGWN